MINIDIHYTPTIYPIYDIPIEELPLTLNGKKHKIKKADFVNSMHDRGQRRKLSRTSLPNSQRQKINGLNLSTYRSY